MTRWTMFAIGLGAYAIALAAAAPATLADFGLQRASDGRLRLAQARGTLWSGAAELEIRNGAGATGRAGHLAWRLTPESLLRGRLAGDVRLGTSADRFPVTLSLSGVDVTNARILLPAMALGMGVPKLAPLGLTGEILIDVERLSISRATANGRATLHWRDAGSSLTPVSPLGDYELRLDADGTAIHAVLRTLAGPLQLEGGGSWAQGGRPAFTGIARLLPEHAQQLAPLLRLIAVERADGRFDLQLD